MSTECIPAQTFYCQCKYVFSEWGPCEPNGFQSRHVISHSPNGCIGVPSLARSCTYVPSEAPRLTYSQMACEVRIQYPQADPANVSVGPMGAWCDAAGMELAVAIALARLLGAK